MPWKASCILNEPPFRNMVSAKKEVTPKLLRLLLVWLVLVTAFLAWHDGRPRAVDPQQWIAFLEDQRSILVPEVDEQYTGTIYILVKTPSSFIPKQWSKAIYSPLVIPERKDQSLRILRFRHLHDLLRFTEQCPLPHHTIHTATSIRALLGRLAIWELKIPVMVVVTLVFMWALARVLRPLKRR